jgi:hypothetical protein
MTMHCPRLALRLLAAAETFGAREEIVGDVLEEIAGGRTRWWVCQQVIGLYLSALATRVRDRARLTPHAVAFALCVMMVAAATLAPISSVLQAWLGLYYVAGTLSLFAHMASADVRASSEAGRGAPERLGDSEADSDQGRR